MGRYRVIVVWALYEPKVWLVCMCIIGFKQILLDGFKFVWEVHLVGNLWVLCYWSCCFVNVHVVMIWLWLIEDVYFRINYIRKRDWVVIRMRETLVDLSQRMITNPLLHYVIIRKDVIHIYLSRRNEVKGKGKGLLKGDR